MRGYSLIIFLLAPLILLSQSNNIIWGETFDTEGIGAWGGEQNIPDTLNWTLDISNCILEDENDYVKTVSTSGGRLEAKDCNGVAIWHSANIPTSGNKSEISIDISETGSGSNPDNKYIEIFITIDNTEKMRIPDSDLLVGNFGSHTIKFYADSDNSISIEIRMMTGYSSDKLIIDNITVKEHIEIEPRQIIIKSMPISVFSNEDFNIHAVVADSLGNVVSNFNGLLRIEELDNEVYAVEGNAQFTLLKPTTTNGWQNITISDIDTILVAATDSIRIIDVNMPTALKENFNELPLSWQGVNSWTIDSSWTVDDATSLRHLPLQPPENKSELWYNNLSIDYNSLVLWTFSFKNGNWTPSLQNRFHFFLCADTSTYSSGIAAGINIKENNKQIEIWEFDNGKPLNLLCSLPLEITDNAPITITVGKEPDETWWAGLYDWNNNRYYKNIGKKITVKDKHYCGVIFEYTDTRAGELWFDNLSIYGNPKLFDVQEFSILHTNKIKILFNKNINHNSINPQTLEIIDSQGNNINITNSSIDKHTLVISFSESDKYDLLLNMKGVRSLDGEELHYSHKFLITDTASHNSLIINEIYANPDTTSPLPTSEYIELLNNHKYPIVTSHCAIKINNRMAALPPDTIFPNEYVVMINSIDKELWRKTSSHNIFIDKLPPLSNDAATISILYNDSNLINSVTYNKHWHTDIAKRKGWALERIDYDRHCGEQQNWTSSVSPTHGTPGDKNSVLNDNSDSEPPVVKSHRFLSPSKIELLFSEIIEWLPTAQEDAIISLPEDYSLTRYIIEDSMLTLELDKALPENRYLTVKLSSNITDLCSNNLEDVDIKLFMRNILPSELIISEVLYDASAGSPEFIELYNISPYATNINNMLLVINKDTIRISIDHIIAPSQCCVLTTDLKLLQSFYHAEYPEVVLELNVPSIANPKGDIAILSSNGVVIDNMRYDDNMHSPLLSFTQGVSLVLSCVDCQTSLWVSSSVNDGFATPSYISEQTKSGTSGDYFEVYPTPFYADHEALKIRYSTGLGEHSSNIKIFDNNGYEIDQIANNDYVYETGEFEWDGNNSLGTACKTGIYIVFIELYTDRGDIIRKKLACTLIRKNIK